MKRKHENSGSIPALIRAVENERIARGLSVTDMAARAGISPMTYYGWRRGDFRPFLFEFLRLVDALGMALAVKGKSGLTVIRPAAAEKRREQNAQAENAVGTADHI